MKTMKTILAVLTIMMALPMTAQTTIVKGTLVDSLSNEGVSYATVRVYPKGKMQKPVAMSLTDVDGRFSQEVKGKGKFVFANTSDTTIFSGGLIVQDSAQGAADVVLLIVQNRVDIKL